MSARSVALAVVRDVFAAPDGNPRGAQESFDYHVRKERLDARDRGFATELAYGAIKMRRLLDWYLAPYIGSRAKPLPPAIAELVRLGIYELRFMRSPEHAVVSEYVGLAKKFGHRGTAGLVNAVLRGFLRDEPPPPQRSAFPDEDEYLAVLHSFPTWIVRQLAQRFGRDDLPRILEGMNAPARAAVSVNTLKASVDEVSAALAAQGVEVQRSPYVEDTLLLAGGALGRAREGESGGAWVVHSESAAMPVDILNPSEGETLLDLCSGRGNKALQEAARLRGDGALTCVEKDARKAAVLERRLEEGGAAAAVVVGDASEPLLGAQRFERVMLDAPCSGIGTLGRHAEARWRKSPEDGQRLAAVQRALLERAASYVHPGGVLVYAVCSTDPRESNEVVDEFLQRNNFSRGLVPARYEPLQNDAGDVVVAPGIEGRDGFFVARLERGG